MVKAILFDMDGVIVDSNPFHRPAWIEFCKAHGVEVDDEFFNQYISGKTNDEAFEVVFKGKYSKEQLTDFAKQKESIYRAHIAPHLAPVTGLNEFLEHAAKHYKLAVGTSACIENVDFTLDGLKIRHYFQAIVSELDVTIGKPNPEVYLKAAEKLGVASKDCIVIEDSNAGVQSGVNAGMKVVGITTTMSEQQLVEQGASLVIQDFIGLDQKINAMFSPTH